MNPLTDRAILVRELVALRLLELRAPDPPPPAGLIQRARSNLLKLATTMEDTTPAAAQSLEIEADEIATAELPLRDYEGPDLASTLLVRMGMMKPEEVDPGRGRKKRTRKLKTTADVVRAIAAVHREIETGAIDPPTARAKLYALQTLLVAMEREDTAPRQLKE